MKQIAFIASLLAALPAIAQNAKVATAYRYMTQGEFEKALENIEPATTHEKTADKEKTWRYRGDIFLGLATGEGEVNRVEALQEAQKSFSKAKELDTKGSWSNEILQGLNQTRAVALNAGIDAFSTEDFAGARDFFVVSGKVGADLGIVDTLAFYNGGLAAEQAGDYEGAIELYKKTAATGYLEGKMYLFIANVYNKKGDDEKYLELLKEGRSKYPNDADLIIYELNYYLGKGEFEQAERNLLLALEKEPDNKQLFFSLGVVYNELGQEEKAVKAYKDAIEIDPDYFDAVYNLGALFFNKGVEMNNAANEIQDNKKYDAARKEARKVFEDSKPYLEKAHELDETDKSALISLSQLYALLGENEKYMEIKKKLDASNQ
jgi:tetratricopeptide (TPR) repeat protein